MAAEYSSSLGMVRWVLPVAGGHHRGVAVLEVGVHLEEAAEEEEVVASWLQEEVAAAAAALGLQNLAMAEEVGDHRVDPE